MSSELYEGINNVIRLSTRYTLQCDYCTFRVAGECITEMINHYIQEHGFKLLHVGTETTLGTEPLFYATVAVLGK
jgi:hypothetical protein